ncbi:Glyoxalase superfamily enzyme, possibly 3-demethylubiquinone-9 3-methyltransferase [Microbulbifer donghaiensis]|uniref:Glyoxalase superfamily enzyme, possibly 3-demethylubiquinone-9 3-methyltransferase n=1 Tax=Microbulbifer donghaiensis TaxID=494016 RepID=A0A1M5GL57_9GAMM|nr:VOC family protein [Microbulbifer donghaiensis]SHG04447.1 Glyoxalase superfamily enzyme, possibly 3-demethylubiquinone-9 3-methyltransferase [Microbulbifer donghaiensis]
MQKITPFLWFDGCAEAAVEFYTGVFPDSKVLGVRRAPKGGPAPEGAVMAVDFQLEGQNFVAINGGPQFQFTPAISLFVSCEDQREVDRLWGKLTEEGEELPCGWLTDRFGVSWQIIPQALGERLFDADTVKAGNVMQAMLKMKKIDIAAIEEAYAS